MLSLMCFCQTLVPRAGSIYMKFCIQNNTLEIIHGTEEGVANPGAKTEGQTAHSLCYRVTGSVCSQAKARLRGEHLEHFSTLTEAPWHP